MNIIIKKLHMENFKIFQKCTINFSNLTKIFAQNYKGKSSIVDAFFWTLFGKSSTGNSEGKQFQPRRYDADGTPIDHVDVIAEITIDVDGREIAVRKVQSQKWVRKRGSEQTTYEGDKNSYFWNEVEVSETEHKKRVAELIDEDLFKKITNPHAFVSMKQDEQRKFLVDNVAQITDADVFVLDDTFAELRALTATKTIEEIKAVNKKALQGYKDLQESIPIRIDEVSKGIMEIDFSSKELQLSALKEKLAEVENQIADTSKSYEEVNRLKGEIADIKGKMDEIERVEKSKHFNLKREAELKAHEINQQINNLFVEISKTKDSIAIKTKSIERNTEFLAQSRKDYAAVKEEMSTIEAEQFDENSLNCPTCNQLLPSEKQTALRSNYEVEKQKRIDAKQKKLQGVIEQGNLFNEQIAKDKKDIEELEKKISEYEVEKTKLQEQLDSKKTELDKLPSEIDKTNLWNLTQYGAYSTLCKKLEEELEKAIMETADIGKLKVDLLTKKQSIQDDIDIVKGILASKQHIDDAKDRVEELREELRQATVGAAKCERLEFILEKFEKAKMNLLSERINQKFKLVQWKLFHTQKNGGIENVCVAMVHGSPYGENTTSTTERLMAGLDIVNTLQEIYGVKAPIWIDNAESYNNFNIPEMGCQMVLLNVSEDPEIKVVNE